MDVNFKKPNPSDLRWIAELEKAIENTVPTAVDTAALRAVCAGVRSSVKELEMAMRQTHEACEKLKASGAKRPSAPSGPRPGPIPVPYPTFGLGRADVKNKIVAAERAVQKHGLAQRKLETMVNQQLSALAPRDAPAKQGLVTTLNKSRIFAQTWSMNVKVEGKNTVRALDLMLHNR